MREKKIAEKAAKAAKAANVCFGGPKRNRLYICGQTSLYSLFLATNAAV